MHPVVQLAASAGQTWAIPDTYGYVLIVGALLGLELLLIGFLFAGGARGKAFSKEFMEEHFGQDHKSATGTEIEKGGMPDMGSGRYSSKLSYQAWFEFNNGQRAHYNFLEMAPTTFMWLFIAGIYFPIPAAIIGVLVIIFRLLYSIGYTQSGPKGRLVGALGNDFCLLGLLGLSLASGIMFAMGNTP